MGFGERFSKVLDGATDLVTAPIGFAVDLVRSFPDENIDFGDPFGTYGAQAIGGAEKILTGTGIAGASGAVKRNTPFDEYITEIFNQAELFYNNEWQVEKNQVPLNLDKIVPGLDPGDASISRFTGAAAGGIAGALPGGSPLDLNPHNLWKKTENSSPGQLVVGNAIGLWEKPSWEQEEIKSGLAWNFSTGVLDAAARWYTDTDVIAGKSIKVARARYTPTVDRRLKLFQKAYGMDAAVAPWVREGSESAFDMTITGARGQKVYTVVRTSELSNAARERALYLMTDREEALRYASNLHAKDAADAPVLLELNPEGLPVIMDDFSMLSKGEDGFPTESNLITVTDSVNSNITNATPLTPADLDYTRYLDDVPEHLQPAKKLNEILYTPDGQAIEPQDLYQLNDLHSKVMGLRESYQLGGETGAMKYIQGIQAQANPGSRNLIDYILGERRVQRALNDMDGKDADYIRRQYFDLVPGGQVIASLMADATSYSERRTIMAASMGLQVPEAVTLQPQALARLRGLTKELDELRRSPEAYANSQQAYRRMSSGVDTMGTPDYDAFKQIIKEEIEEVYNQRDLGNWYAAMGQKAVLDRPARYSRIRRGQNALRETSFYQSSPLARPLRSVIQKRPYRWVNLHDANGDTQIVRQMEEGTSLIGAKYLDPSRAAHYRNRWMTAQTEPEKMAISIAMDDEIIQAAGRKAGLTKAQMEQALNASRDGRQSTRQIMSSRRYSPDMDADLVDWMDELTGENVQMSMPLLGTQLQNWVPLTDVEELNKIATRIQRHTERFGAVSDSGRYLLDEFYSLWKPAVLLRGGWPIRVVSDEQLRILAKTGSILHHLASIEVGERPSALGPFQTGLGTVLSAERTANVYGSLASIPTAISVRAAATVSRGARALRLVKPQYYDDLVEAGTEKLASARAAFNGPTQAVNQEFESLLGRTEAGIFDHLVGSSTGQWASVGRSDPNYLFAWTRALEAQIGNDPLARVMLEASLETDILDEVQDAALTWLESAEGIEYAKRLPWQSNKLKWVREVDSMIDTYSAGYEEDLVRATLGGKVSANLLHSVDESMRPATIHAEIIDQTMGKSRVNQYIGQVLETTFDTFGRLPTDTLSRQPFFRHNFADEMKRQRKILEAQGVDVEDLAVVQGMQSHARGFALQQVNEYLYNLAETSRFADTFKFLFPFFNAWEEVLKVWGKIALDDPSVIARGHLLWTAPDKAGLTIKDDEGNQYLQFSLSEKMADDLELTGWKKYLAVGGVRVGKSSFNLMLNSPLPGFGPLIQAPVNEIVKNKPELEETLSFILPYGIQQNSLSLLTSPIFKRLSAWVGGPEGDRSYESHFTNVVSWMDYEYRSGKRTNPPTLEEAHHTAKMMFMMQSVANFTSPAQPLFDSPMKPYIDVYRQLQTDFGGDADEIFINKFGAEFISLTLSRTISSTGIPPTVEAQQAREHVEGLISKYPEFGRLIIGEDAATGEFSSAAFAWQMTNTPTDDPAFRDELERRYRILTLDPETGTIEESDKRLGWDEYIKAMDTIEVEMRSQGLTSLRLKEAAPLAALKTQVTQALATKYPSWWREFNLRDSLKWDTRTKALNNIASNPLMDDRGDMRGVRQYMEMRQAIQAELNRRKQLGGSSTLTAQSNQDLSVLWENMVYSVLQENVAFSPIYYRYLEGDPLG